MQVFIVGSPLETAMALSKRHLNNQINEAKIILDALNGVKAWRSHPCVLQYRGYEKWLGYYATCLALYARGDDTMARVYSVLADKVRPKWHSDEYYDQMKRRLYTKDEMYYHQWAELGSSYKNWYWSQEQGGWIKYVNGKREIEYKQSSAREFIDKMCVKSDKYAESLRVIAHIYQDYSWGKNEVPSTIKKMSRVLADMGFTSYRCSDGLYFGIEIKGNRPNTLIRDLDIRVPSKTKEETEIPF